VIDAASCGGQGSRNWDGAKVDKRDVGKNFVLIVSQFTEIPKKIEIWISGISG
jgi:hypothetical protein